MELTGGYLEETITVDINTGHKSCAVYIRTYVDKNLNDHLGSMEEQFLKCQVVLK